jgi:hypothetical protein
MFQPYLKMLVICGLACIVLTFAAQVWGTGQQPIQPIEAFKTHCEDKPQPCLFGVIPGTTTQSELLEHMNFAGTPRIGSFLVGDGINISYTLLPPWPYCYAVFSLVENVVIRVELSLCRQPAIHVGDLANIWSDLTQVMSLPPYELVYGTASINADGWPKLYSRVSYIILLSPDNDIYRYPWYGFISQDRYCQLVPRFPRCRTLR